LLRGTIFYNFRQKNIKTGNIEVDLIEENWCI